MKRVCALLLTGTAMMPFGSALADDPAPGTIDCMGTPDPKLVRVEPPAQADTLREQARDISAELEKIIEKHKVPGMVAMAIEGRRVIVQGAAGVRRADRPEKITIDDRMHLGSCTKAMTATLCARLVERGKLTWGLNLAEAFPELTPAMSEAWKPVTLEQLLTNSGGVPGDLSKNGLWGKLWKLSDDGPGPRRVLLQGVLEYQPAGKPGEKFEYSNAGFAIAGHMAEVQAAMTYEQLLKAEVFGPLGITTGGFGPPGEPGAPQGHTADGKPVGLGRNADNPTAITPAGRVHMTIGDWARFVSVHLRGERGEPDTLAYLKPETFKKLHTAGSGAGATYAMGWSVSSRPWAKGDGPGDSGRVLTHSGSNTMWYCVTWLAPEKDFAVLVCCNQGGGAAACDEACGALIKAWRERGARRDADTPKPKQP